MGKEHIFYYKPPKIKSLRNILITLNEVKEKGELT